MTADALVLLAMAGHVGWTTLLYVALTLARAPRVWGQGAAEGFFARREAAIAANLSNQFEWPLFFHVVCGLAISAGTTTPGFALIAWLFLTGRALHSGVQILTDNVRLRGLIFTINFLAVLVLWGLHGAVLLRSSLL
ncbi:MAG: MAPEG family protein [Pseudomonadota bacterium]